MDPTKNSKFKDLQDKWYAKLEKEGFKDIEQDETRLKLWTSHLFAVRFNKTLFEAKEEYYRLAGRFLNDYLFKDSKERRIWELHAEGISMQCIVNKMKKQNFKIYKSYVQETINRLSKVMIENANK